MAYPRLLELSDERETALKAHLDQILITHDGEREAFIDDLIKWQKDYWAKPNEERRKFPFTGAANIIIPLTAIAFETVHARTMAQLFGLKQLVSVKAVNAAWNAVATPFERYMNHELKHGVKFREGIESSIIELEKLGTGVACAYYERLIKYGVREIGGVEQEFPVTVRQGARVNSVPLSRFLFPFSATEVETAPWVGEEHSVTPYELELRESSGLFYEGTYDALKFYYTNPQLGGMKYQESQEALEHRQTSAFDQKVDFVELWLPFETEKNGNAKEIVVFYHRPSRMLMGVRHNWNYDLRRKYRTGVYFPVEHRITGVGISKQNEQFQREVTTQHRQRLDNATLANMRMIKVSKLSGYGPNEPIFPGKMWFLDDLTQVDTFQLGEIYPSAYNNEQQTLLYSQQRTGVNEAVLGMPQVGTPGTATSDLARVQEGKKKFDYTYSNIKTFVDKIIIDVACNIQQFGPSSLSYFENIEGGQLVEQFLTLPPDLIKDSLILEIASAGERDNDITDRQNWMQVAQLMVQYYTQIMQLAAQIGDQQLMALISQKALGASTEAMRQILESYDLRNVDQMIVTELLNNGAAGSLIGGGGQGALGPQSPGGVAAPQEIAALLGTINGRGAAGVPQL